MRRIARIICAAMAVALAGCRPGQEAPPPGDALTGDPPPADASHGPPRAEAEGDRVVLGRNAEFGRMTEDIYAEFAEPEPVDAFADAVRTAEKMSGILDVVHPDYDVVLVKGGKRQEFHLWLDADSGMIMFAADTHTGYRLRPEAAAELHLLVRDARYEPDRAEANGDVVNAHGDIRNLDRWESFVDSVRNGRRGDVQVVQYTVEGAPIFSDLTFDGETFRHRYDNRLDGCGTPTQRFESCAALEERETERGAVYTLGACGERRESLFHLLIPKEGK